MLRQIGRIDAAGARHVREQDPAADPACMVAPPQLVPVADRHVVHFLDMVAERFQQTCHLPHPRGDLRVDVRCAAPAAGRQGNFQRPRVARDGIEVGTRRRCQLHEGAAIGNVVQIVIDGGGIAHRAGHHALDRDARHIFVACKWRRHTSTGRLQPDQAAERRGNADRTAAIRRHRNRRDPGRHRHRRATRGTARRAFRIPRIAGDDGLAGTVRRGVEGHAVFRRGGAAKRHEAGAQEIRDQRISRTGHVTLHQAGTGFLAPPAQGGPEVLQEDRHAVQAPVAIGMVDIRVGHTVREQLQHCVQFWIDVCHGGGGLRGDFTRADLAPAHQIGEAHAVEPAPFLPGHGRLRGVFGSWRGGHRLRSPMLLWLNVPPERNATSSRFEC